MTLFSLVARYPAADDAGPEPECSERADAPDLRSSPVSTCEEGRLARSHLRLFSGTITERSEQTFLMAVLVCATGLWKALRR